jgi:hypothetical protein
MTVQRPPSSSSLVAHASELLAAYDFMPSTERHPGFWAPHLASSTEHCLWCFGRQSSQRDPLILCEGMCDDGTQCSLGRHFHCLPSTSPAVPLQFALHDVHFFCKDHLGPVRAQLPTAILLSPSAVAPSVRIRRAAANLMTPPSKADRPAAAGLASNVRGALMIAASLHSVAHAPSCSAASAELRTAHTGTQVLSPAVHVIRQIHSIATEPACATPHGAVSPSSTGVSVQLPCARPDQISAAHPLGVTAAVHLLQPSVSASPMDTPASASSSQSDMWESDSVASSGSQSQSSHNESSAPSKSFTSASIASGTVPLRSLHSILGHPSYRRALLSTADHAAMLVDLQSRCRGSGKKPWFWKKRTCLDDWQQVTEARRLDAPMPLAGNAAPVDSEHLLKIQRGQKGWTSALLVTLHHAEYKLCCGSPERVAGLLASGALPADLLAEHASTSIVHMFRQRVQYRQRAGSSEAFIHNVIDSVASVTKATAAARSIAWAGGLVCLSCFRALLGVGHSTMRRWMTSIALSGPDDPRGAAAMPSRERLKFDLCRKTLLAYCEEHQQFDPGAGGSKSLQHKDYVLAFHRLTALRDALNDVLDDDAHRNNAMALGSGAPMGRTVPRISSTTLRRVIRELKITDDIHVKTIKSKAVCRCNDCETLERAITATKRLTAARLVAKENMRSHLATASAQREHFNEKRRLAMANPRQLWAWTFDGFDQSKTQLPHVPRLSKELEGKPLLGTHWVGAYAYGSPVPVLAFVNDESVIKDSSLSCTIVFKIMQVQWDRLVHKYSEGAREVAMSAVEAAAVATRAERYAASHWPSRLHLTFDNAASEAKNQFFFRTLAALVHYGVFEAITASTMLVGHTHDIVDQMFRSDTAIPECSTMCACRHLIAVVACSL